MDFVGNSDFQVEEILKDLGIGSVDALFESIPDSIREPAPAQDDGLSEWEGLQLMERLSEENSYLKNATRKAK